MEDMDLDRNLVVPETRVLADVGDHLVHNAIQARPSEIDASLEVLDLILDLICTHIGGRAVQECRASLEAVNNTSFNENGLQRGNAANDTHSLENGNGENGVSAEEESVLHSAHFSQSSVPPI